MSGCVSRVHANEGMDIARRMGNGEASTCKLLSRLSVPAIVCDRRSRKPLLLRVEAPAMAKASDAPASPRVSRNRWCGRGTRTRACRACIFGERQERGPSAGTRARKIGHVRGTTYALVPQHTSLS